MVVGPPVQWSPKGLFVTGVGILGDGRVEVGGGVVTTGITEIVGEAALGPTVLANGDTRGVGIGAKELTPRLAISQEASGIPTLGLPPGVVGVIDVGIDGDVGGLLEPVPHIPDTPTVPIAVLVDIPPIGDVAGFVDAADVETPTACAPPDVVVLLVIAAIGAVAVAVEPIAIPPPS